MFPVGGPNPTPSGNVKLRISCTWSNGANSGELDMNYTVVINMAVWLGATAYYVIDARKWFKGPKVTVDLSLLTEEQEEVLREEGVEIEGLGGQKNELTSNEAEEGVKV